MKTNDCFLKGLLSLFLFAMDSTSFAAGNPHVKYLGIDQGLSNNAVTCIYQDGRGFMWAGTYDGLDRYDGYGFTVYRNVIGDPGSIPFNNIATISSDRHSRLWVGGQKGLTVFDQVTGTFSLPTYIPSDGAAPIAVKEYIHVVAAMGGSEMLVGSHSSGLLIFADGSTTGRQVPLPELKTQKGSYDVFCIQPEIEKKRAWVFIQGRGLYLFNVDSGTLTSINNKIRQCFSLKIDHNGRLWAGSDNGLQYFDATHGTWSPNILPQRTRVVCINIERNNDLYIGTDGAGLWRIPAIGSPAPVLSTSGSPLVNSNAVYSIYTDKDGRHWVGTLRGGISVIEPEKSTFTTYTVPGRGNPIDNFILSFCEDKDQHIWIGTDGSGLRLWNRNTGTFKTFQHHPNDPQSLGDNFITGILRDHKDRLWISTWFEGVERYDRKAATFDPFSCFDPETNTEAKHIWDLVEDHNNRIWASATNEGGLYRFNETTARFELFDNSVHNLQTLYEDREGELWGGNYSSLIHIDPDHKRSRLFQINYTVRSIHEDKSRQFWVGTQDGGLLLFDRHTGSYKQFTTANGLPSNTILRILEDSRGNLWLSTYNGLSEFQQKEQRFRNFSTSDGLQSMQFSFNAALTLSTGEMLFGGIKGFNLFKPDSAQRPVSQSNIYLTGVRVRNEAVGGNSPYITAAGDGAITALKVPFNQAMLSLDFTALDYGCTDKLNYSYQLSGWDKDWSNSNGSRTANYAALREGDYTFKVRVSRADGTWSASKTLLHIVILPPWYRTWWAYLAYLAIVAAIGAFYRHYSRTRWRMRYELQLAHMETQKEKELMERKLSFFTHISHEFRNPLTLIINPVKDLLATNRDTRDTESLHLVHRNAQRLLSLVDQLLLFRKAESGLDRLKPVRLDLDELCRQVFMCFIDGARTKKIDYRFESPGTPVPAVVDKEKIEIVLYNLISNALKYTPEKGKVDVRLAETTGGQFLIEVRDTGPGIPQDAAGQLFSKFSQIGASASGMTSGFGIGLYLVKQFVEAHQGTITFESTKGMGTIFRASLPAVALAPAAGKSIEGLSALVREMAEDAGTPIMPATGANASTGTPEGIVTQKPRLLVVDDDRQMLNYVCQIFEGRFIVHQAVNGEEGLTAAREHKPDLVISDLHMDGISGLELCETIKNDPALGQIPVILLTASASANYKLEGAKHGADDYITKPFDRDLLIARVGTLLESRDRVERSIYHAIVHGVGNSRLTADDKDFLERIVAVVEDHLDDDDFSVARLSAELGMSHSKVYQRLKEVTGEPLTVFIRSIRLKKAAELFINSSYNVNEVAFMVGIGDVKYFREQFNKQFGMNPSEYIKTYRKVFSAKYQFNKNVNSPPNF